MALSHNCALVLDNLVDGATVTASASAGSISPSRVKSGLIGEKWKSGDGDDYLLLDFGGVIEADSFAALGVDAEYARLRLSTTDATGAAGDAYDSGARTNAIRNSKAGGSTLGVIGSGGAWPTNWGVITTASLTYQIMGTGREDDIDYVDVKVSGTASGAVIGLRFESTTNIAALQGQVWANSVYLRDVSTGYGVTKTGFNGAQIRIAERDAGGSLLVSGLSTLTAVTTAGLATQRHSLVRTLANASTAWNAAQMDLQVTNGGSVSFVLRIGLPQAERTAVTAPIRTGGTALTVGDAVDQTHKHAVWLSESSVSFRYMRIDLQAPTAGFSQVGRVVAGLRNTFAYNFGYGGSITPVDPSPRSVTIGSGVRKERRPNYRQIVLPFEWISTGDRYGFIETMVREKGLSGEMLLLVDPASDNLPRDTIWVLAENGPPLSWLAPDLYSAPLTFREQL